MLSKAKVVDSKGKSVDVSAFTAVANPAAAEEETAEEAVAAEEVAADDASDKA